MTTTSNNDLSTYIANTSVVNSTSFIGAFQVTVVGSNKLTIHMIVPLTISADSYLKAMITILFFVVFFLSLPLLLSLLAIWLRLLRHISHFLQVRRDVSLTRSANLFHVDNLQDIWFLDSSGKSTLVSYLSSHAVDLVFFIFRSTVTESDVDNRFPSTTLSLDFLLRLLQSVTSTTTAPVINLPASVLSLPRVFKPVSSPDSASHPSPKFYLENTTDDVLTLQ